SAADGGAGVLHRADHLVLERLELFSQGGAGLLHLLADQFFVFHWMFSFKPWIDCSGRGVKASKRLLPQKIRAAATAPRTTPTMPIPAQSGSAGHSHDSKWPSASARTMDAARPTTTPAISGIEAAVVRRKSCFSSTWNRLNC